MSVYQSQDPEASVLIEGKRRLVSLYVFNVQSSKRYVFVYNGSASGALLAGPFPVEAESGIALQWGDDAPKSGSAGVYIASSSADWPFAAGGSDFLVRAEYA